jgi:hypothetical protein
MYLFLTFLSGKSILVILYIEEKAEASLKVFLGRKGFSLLIIWIILFSFLAAFPLIFRQIDDGQRRSEAFSQWIRYQMAAESSLQVLASTSSNFPALLPATYSYPLSGISTFSIGFIASLNIPDNGQATAAARAYVLRDNKTFYSGFRPTTFIASFQFLPSTDANTAARYFTWSKTDVDE